MYYIPSIEKESTFKEVTIQQFKKIVNKESFNFVFIDILKDNNIEEVILTNFDKEILLAQIHLNEIKQVPIINKVIAHPNKQSIKEGLYNITINVPSIEQEQEYCLLIESFDKKNRDNFLLAEIGKYIHTLLVNETEIDCNITLIKKVQIIKDLPPGILAKCIKCIDNIKYQIKAYYTQNNIAYKYDLSLLVP